MKTINELSAIVRQTAYDIHVYHGNGAFLIYAQWCSNRCMCLSLIMT